MFPSMGLSPSRSHNRRRKRRRRRRRRREMVTHIQPPLVGLRRGICALLGLVWSRCFVRGSRKISSGRGGEGERNSQLLQARVLP
jgi:hypothetical protein